jgi:hypothetical protein
MLTTGGSESGYPVRGPSKIVGIDENDIADGNTEPADVNGDGEVELNQDLPPEMSCSITPRLTRRRLRTMNEGSSSARIMFQTVFGEQLRSHAASGMVRASRFGSGSTATTGLRTRRLFFRRLEGGLVISRGVTRAHQSSGSQSGPLIHS